MLWALFFFFSFLFCFFWKEAVLDFKFSIPFGLHNYIFTDPAKAVVLHRDDFAPQGHVATSRGICIVTAGRAGEASGMQRAEASDLRTARPRNRESSSSSVNRAKAENPGHGASGQVF